MKKILYFVFVTVLMAAVGCNKEAGSVGMQESPAEYVIGIDYPFEAFVTTRATAITSMNQLSTLYWSANSGSNTNESKKYPASGTSAISGQLVNNGGTYSIATGEYQSSPATSLKWYVSNHSFTAGPNPSMSVTANDDMDILVGISNGNNGFTSDSNPSIQLKHIFSRIGVGACANTNDASFTLTADGGYTATVVSWEIQGPRTTGTYNLKNQAWNNASNGSSYTSLMNNADIYFIPGTYTIRVRYTLSIGGWTSDQITKTQSVSFPDQGKIYGITGHVTGEGASELTLGITMTDWVGDNVDVNF